MDGNTSYEELECVGLSPDESLLAGIIRVKQSNGYSGGPCTAGSKEFVTFWADTDNNGSFDTCLGTTSVTVYDTDSGQGNNTNEASVGFCVREPQP